MKAIYAFRPRQCLAVHNSLLCLAALLDEMPSASQLLGALTPLPQSYLFNSTYTSSYIEKLLRCLSSSDLTQSMKILYFSLLRMSGQPSFLTGVSSNHSGIR